MRANPGKATVGAVGVGGPTDIAALYFQKQTGTRFQIVPYRGGAPLVQDLVAGQIDLTFGQAANYLAHVRGGRLKAYAVLAKRRWWAAPDVPTMDEAGVPGFYSSFWHGLWVPKGTPKDVIEQAPRRGRAGAGRSRRLEQRFKDIGQEVWPRAGADAGGTRRHAEGRDREMVADHQGGQHQGAVTIKINSGPPQGLAGRAAAG